MGSLSRRVVSRRDEPSGIWAIQKNLLTHDFKQRDLDDRPTADSDSRQRRFILVTGITTQYESVFNCDEYKFPYLLTFLFTF